MWKIANLILTGFLGVALTVGIGSAAVRKVPITYKGKPKAVIVLGSDASVEDMQAAETLADYLKKISGATIPVLPNRNKLVKKKTNIFVGPNKYLTKKKIKVPSDIRDAFIIRTVGSNRIVLLGNGVSGTTYSVNAFLEELGCRWFMPGEIGEVVPSDQTIRITKMDRLQIPDFRVRHFVGVGQEPARGKAERQAFYMWMLRNRFNRAYGAGFESHNILNGPSSHAYSKIIPENKFETAPELFSLINGERRLTKQRCVSDPLALELGLQYIDRHFETDPMDDLISVSPNDGGGWCQGENCKTWDLPDKYIMGPRNSERSYSGRTFKYADLIAQDMQVSYPDKLALIYAYDKYSVPPSGFVPSDNLIVKLTHNRHACDAHPISSRQCELNSWWREQVADGWSDLTSNLWFHQYAYRWKACELPYHKWRSIGKDVKYLHEAGVWGYFAHAGYSNWGSNGLYYYVLSKLMWDVDADTNAIVDDYCKKFYGSAAGSMKQYLYFMADAFEAQAAHIENIGGVKLAFVEQMLDIYTPEVLEHGSLLLEEAAKAADTPMTADRVRLMDFTHRYAVLFINFLQANLERKLKSTPETIRKTIDAGERVLTLLENEYIPLSVTLKQSIYGAEETVHRILTKIFVPQP